MWGVWDRNNLIEESRLQSRVTHPHAECVAGSVFVSVAIYYMVDGLLPAEAVARALAQAEAPLPLQETIRNAPSRRREELANSGWVRHTLESAVWGLRTSSSFEEALVQVVNLGKDADTAGAVVGALAGAAYGLAAIPARWRAVLRGEWPLRSGVSWDTQRLIELADRLAGVEEK